MKKKLYTNKEDSPVIGRIFFIKKIEKYEFTSLESYFNDIRTLVRCNDGIIAFDC